MDEQIKKETLGEFLRTYGGIYEHSPWVAEAAWVAKWETAESLHAAMKAAVTAAPRDKKLALIRAHPDLACAPAAAAKLTQSSISEQKGAGLNQCTAQEYAEFQQLNADYKKKFGFPFIVAVKGMTRHDILSAFRKRIRNSPEEEFETALAQIHRIAWVRLAALMESHGKN